MNARAFLFALGLFACAAPPARPVDAAARDASAAPSAIEAARTEVAAIRAAARDATEAMEADAAAWERARTEIPTPLVRASLEAALAAHAARHVLALSRLVLLPPPDDGFDPPKRFHPAAPFPVRREDAILHVPLRFVLAPLRDARLEAFVRTLGTVRPIVVVRAIVRASDRVEIEATAPTFRRFEPAPRYALALPDPASLRDDTDPDRFEADWAALERELEATNEALAALSAARLRHVRVQAWADASNQAAQNAEAIEIPSPARPRAVAP